MSNTQRTAGRPNSPVKSRAHTLYCTDNALDQLRERYPGNAAGKCLELLLASTKEAKNVTAAVYSRMQETLLECVGQLDSLRVAEEIDGTVVFRIPQLERLPADLSELPDKVLAARVYNKDEGLLTDKRIDAALEISKRYLERRLTDRNDLFPDEVEAPEDPETETLDPLDDEGFADDDLL